MDTRDFPQLQAALVRAQDAHDEARRWARQAKDLLELLEQHMRPKHSPTTGRARALHRAAIIELVNRYPE